MNIMRMLIDSLFLSQSKRSDVSDLIIRAAMIEDAESIVLLRKQADKDRANRNPPLDPYGGNYPTIEQQISEILEYTNKSNFLVAEVEKKIVGIAYLFEIRTDLGEYNLKIVVSKAWRNNGIGTSLVMQIKTWAEFNESVKLLVVSFEKSYKKTKHFFSKLGFHVKEQGWAWYMQGAMYNRIEMLLTVR